MPTDVNPRRAYNSEGRQQRAAVNRATVLDVAQRAFLERGYGAVSVPAIAQEAGVSAEFVYKAFGPKPELLKAVFDRSVTGDDAPVALQERPDIRRLVALIDPAEVLDGYADLLGTIQARVAPVYLLAREAAAADPAAAPVLEEMNAQRLSGMGAMAHQLLRLGRLRPGLEHAEIRDTLWTFNAPEVYELLVVRRGWELDRYVDFVRRGLRSALLAEGTAGPRPGPQA